MRTIHRRSPWGIPALFMVMLSSCQKQEALDPGASALLQNSKAGAPAVALTEKELLGEFLFNDKISVPNNQSCSSCHDPNYGYTGPNAGQNLISGIFGGAQAHQSGSRRPPSAAYAVFNPVFYWDDIRQEFRGGNFWDGRATGEHLGNPSADQALAPFLSTKEMNNPSKASVLQKVASSKYAPLWEKVWGEPISYDQAAYIEKNYDRIGLSIASYEASAEVSPFTSKYDYFLNRQVDLTEEELNGLTLFNGKARCAQCHTAGGSKPLFTNFTFSNIGTPKNPANPIYKQDPGYIDAGLGGFLKDHPNPEWQARTKANWGKHKVPTLRNVDRRPGPGVTKAYMHNGVFKSLEEVVHFYNTRDVISWPAPEVLQNMNTADMGRLNLTPAEEKAIVTFMKALTDGYTPKKN